MQKTPFRQKKRSMGQVFLTETWPVKRMLKILEDWKVKRVIEIGPGPGILTKGLLEAGLSVTAIEKDDYLYEQLKEQKKFERLPNSDRFEVIHEDILKFDYDSWLNRSHEKAAIVGNIPYNISSPILIAALSHIPQTAGLIFLTQLEFAMRVSAPSNTKSYGSLTVFSQIRSKVNLECKVDRACFRPPPRVDSAIISLQPRDSGLSFSELVKVELITRACFMHRRKVLRNALRPYLEKKPESGCPIDLNRRPETLRIDEFVELTRYFFPEAFEDSL